MSKVNIIVACDKNFGISKDGDIPWNIPSDLKFFRKTTLNSNIIMGRKTHESIGRILKDRKNIILSRSLNSDNPNIHNSIESAIEYADSDKEIFIIGGSEVYNYFLNEKHYLVNKIYLSVIDGNYECDKHISNIYKLENFQQTQRTMKDGFVIEIFEHL